MNRDETIDDVAREMTTLTAPPALRTQVMARLGKTTRDRSTAWVAPALGAAAALAAVAVWWSASSPLRESAAIERPVATVEVLPSPPVTEPGSVDVARRPVALRVRQSIATRAPGQESAQIAPADVPDLPALSGPAPIAIEPIVWEAITIAPVAVAQIEFQRLEVAPLAGDGRDGV